MGEGCDQQQQKPEHVLKGLKTPVFVVNSAYDWWQISNILVPGIADPEGLWDSCKASLLSCSESQLRVVQGFRDSFLQRLEPLLDYRKDGAYVDSCYVHCQTDYGELWSGGGGGCPSVEGKSIARVVGDCYFERDSTKVVDCPFPCNPSCGGYVKSECR